MTAHNYWRYLLGTHKFIEKTKRHPYYTLFMIGMNFSRKKDNEDYTVICQIFKL